MELENGYLGGVKGLVENSVHIHVRDGDRYTNHLTISASQGLSRC